MIVSKNASTFLLMLQVMAQEKVSERFMAMKKPGTFPVNFFGDNEFGWCPSEDMLSLPDKYKELSTPKMGRQYRVSCLAPCSDAKSMGSCLA